MLRSPWIECLIDLVDFRTFVLEQFLALWVASGGFPVGFNTMDPTVLEEAATSNRQGHFLGLS